MAEFLTDEQIPLCHKAEPNDTTGQSMLEIYFAICSVLSAKVRVSSRVDLLQAHACVRFDQAIAFGTCSFVLRDIPRHHLIHLAAHDPERYDELFGGVPRIESYTSAMMCVLSAINFSAAAVLAWAARCAGAIATWSEVVEGLLSWGNVRACCVGPHINRLIAI